MTPSRAARGWIQLALHVGLFVLGLGLLQVAAERTNRRIDLTPSRALSLSPVARQVVAQVTAPMTITVFHRRGEGAAYEELLQLLRRENPNVRGEALDLDRYPERARNLGVTGYGRAAIDYQDRRVQTLALPESELVGAMLRIVRGTPRRVLFTSGHGERTLTGKDGLGRLAAALRTENYEIGSLPLLDAGVPAGTDLVVVAGPQRDFLRPELDALAAYLRDGGGVVMLLDPASLPGLSDMLASLGVALGDDFIVDRERRIIGTDGLAAVVELFKRGNPVTDAPGNPLEAGVVLPSARTVDVSREVEGVDAASIARTAPSAWAVADPDRARRGEAPSAALHDVQGSASVMVVADVGLESPRSGRRGRLVVIGDADLATDPYVDLLGNRDLVLNAIAWASAEGVLAGARQAEAPETFRPLSPLVLTETQVQRIGIVAAAVQPAIVLLLGLVVLAWVRR